MSTCWLQKSFHFKEKSRWSLSWSSCRKSSSHLYLPTMWKELSSSSPSCDPLSYSHRRKTIRLWISRMWKALESKIGFEATSSFPYRWKTICLPCLQQTFLNKFFLQTSLSHPRQECKTIGSKQSTFIRFLIWSQFRCHSRFSNGYSNVGFHLSIASFYLFFCSLPTSNCLECLCSKPSHFVSSPPTIFPTTKCWFKQQCFHLNWSWTCHGCSTTTTTTTLSTTTTPKHLFDDVCWKQCQCIECTSTTTIASLCCFSTIQWCFRSSIDEYSSCCPTIIQHPCFQEKVKWNLTSYSWFATIAWIYICKQASQCFPNRQWKFNFSHSSKFSFKSSFFLFCCRGRCCSCSSFFKDDNEFLVELNILQENKERKKKSISIFFLFFFWELTKKKSNSFIFVILWREICSVYYFYTFCTLICFIVALCS